MKELFTPRTNKNFHRKDYATDMINHIGNVIDSSFTRNNLQKLKLLCSQVFNTNHELYPLKPLMIEVKEKMNAAHPAEKRKALSLIHI